MRGSEEGDTGELGESAAGFAFQRFGWPSVRTSKRELGTDLWVEVRDRRFDPGVLIGVQAKSGPSTFNRPRRDDAGQVIGWTHRASTKHLDRWLGHSIPHLLVLYDASTDTCFWEHIQEPAVTCTPRGGTVFVPVDQTVDAANLDRLLQAAATARPGVPLEGTVWTGAPPAQVVDHLRFALIAPRLIAPHPNRDPTPLSPSEAVALIVQGRVRQVWRYGDPLPDTPSLADARTHDVWGWRFAAALEAWMSSEDRRALLACLESAEGDHERAAAAAVAGHTYFVEGRARDALALIDRELARDAAMPVDYAWLSLQQSRGLLDLGRLDDARVAAETALPIGQTVRGDPTASAITGTASAILFNSNPWEGDIGGVVGSNDTAVGWWRSQGALVGALAQVELSFSRAVAGGDSDNESMKANNHMFAAATQAGFLGSQGQWRHFTQQLARHHLLRADATVPAKATQSLELLRLAGDDTGMKRAAAWLVAQGPAVSVARCAGAVDLETSTATTVPAALELIRVAGDLLPPDAAEAAARWLLAAAEDPAHLRSMFPSRVFDELAAVGEWLEGPVASLGEAGAEIVVEGIERFGDDIEGVAEIHWDELICGMPTEYWTSQLASRLVAAVPARTDRLHRAVFAVDAEYNVSSYNRLIDEVLGGHLGALHYVTNLAVLDASTLSRVVDTVQAKVRVDLIAASKSKLGHATELDPLSLLTRLVLDHDDSDSWTLLADALASPDVPGSYKGRALQMLAFQRAQIPEERRRQVAVAAAAVASSSPTPPIVPWERPIDLRPMATFVQRTLCTDPGDLGPIIGRLAGGPSRDRGWAAAFANVAGDVGSLVLLARDRAPAVRAAAAEALTQLAVEGNQTDTVLEGVRRAADDPGRTTALAVAERLTDAGSDVLSDVRTTLSSHVSRRVREHAARHAAT